MLHVPDLRPLHTHLTPTHFCDRMTLTHDFLHHALLSSYVNKCEVPIHPPNIGWGFTLTLVVDCIVDNDALGARGGNLDTAFHLPIPR